MKSEQLPAYEEPQVETITDGQILEELGEAQACIPYGNNFIRPS